MLRAQFRSVLLVVLCASFVSGAPPAAWELSPAADRALNKGLDWLVEHQAEDGAWATNDTAVQSMGVLALLSAGVRPGKGDRGDALSRAIACLLRDAQPDGRIVSVRKVKNTGLSALFHGDESAPPEIRHTYNHAISLFVLGQACAIHDDPQWRKTASKGMKALVEAQCRDGGWDYVLRSGKKGHDLSVTSKGILAIRSLIDAGIDPPEEAVRKALAGLDRFAVDKSRGKGAGSFTYEGNRSSMAMAACGALCLETFELDSDWRLPINLATLRQYSGDIRFKEGEGRLGNSDGYTTFYLGLALFESPDDIWKETYPRLRDGLVKSQAPAGYWQSRGHIGGEPGDVYGTAVGCVTLALVRRQLPILSTAAKEKAAARISAWKLVETVPPDGRAVPRPKTAD